ncbi:F-box protein CPR1-like [Mercurialis annua]|uniref:F-box protein CPR1-like n=1 Tax=Mercurialis annua TaxID=3986 RepID=UPI00215E9F46|nr:F-box protein CPR1-like [Mercurialis annua]
MEETFPQHILTEILVRLPVECLFRFRSVSKSWCALIDGPIFIKTHLKNSLQTKSTLSLILTDPNPDFLYWASFDSLSNALQGNALTFHELDYPFKGTFNANSPNIRIVGSCNGLLCFGNATGGTLLMNPFTRKHYVLPYLIMDANVKVKGKSIWGAWAFGFGYDSVNDDYKVVRLGQYAGLVEPYFDTETMVYSHKLNSWKNIPGMSYVLGSDQKMGLLVGDSLHWLVARNKILQNPDLIVAFDLGVEKFREVPGPELAVGGQNPLLSLGAVEKWLSVYAIYKVGRLDIWAMKEYGVKGSWTRMFSFTPNVVPSLKCTRTLVFSKSGDEILLGLLDKNLLWYSVKEKSVKKVEIHTVVDPFTVEVFSGSLVPLNVNVKKETTAKKARPRKGRKNRDEFLSKDFKLIL